jgi:hypothetical protein
MEDLRNAEVSLMEKKGVPEEISDINAQFAPFVYSIKPQLIHLCKGASLN